MWASFNDKFIHLFGTFNTKERVEKNVVKNASHSDRNILQQKK